MNAPGCEKPQSDRAKDDERNWTRRRSRTRLGEPRLALYRCRENDFSLRLFLIVIQLSPNIRQIQYDVTAHTGLDLLRTSRRNNWVSSAWSSLARKTDAHLIDPAQQHGASSGKDELL